MVKVFPFLTRKPSRHWLQQRLSALLVLLGLPWPLWFLLHTGSFSTAALIHMIQMPFFSIPFTVWFLCAIWHGQMGLRVVVEDYVPHLIARRRWVMAMTGLACALGMSFFLAVIWIQFRGTF
jgi:succinate dehydrogenase / fumarate reductase membrane anchor subunit